MKRFFFALFSIMASLSLAFTACAATPPDAPNSARSVSSFSRLNAPLSGYIKPRGDIDWYKFNLTSPGDLVITETAANCRFSIALYSQSNLNTPIASNSALGRSRISRYELQKGVYLVRVTGSASNTPYSLNAAFTANTWTVLAYLDGDNNLAPNIKHDLNEMEAVGSTAKVNLVALYDGAGSGDSYRYKVLYDKNGADNAALVSRQYAINSANEVNMGSAATLQAFIVWAKRNFPAQNYFLILNDHGGGWPNRSVSGAVIKDGKTSALPKGFKVGQSAGSSKGICWDDNSNSDFLTTTELGSVLNNAFGTMNKLSVMGFDACLMAMMEVDAQIRPYARYRVGSEPTEPGYGWPYNEFLSHLKATPTMTPAALAGLVVKEYGAFYGPTGFAPDPATALSAVDLGTPYGTLLNKTSALADKLRTYVVDSASFQAVSACKGNIEYVDRNYLDLGSFCNRISGSTAIADPNVVSAARDLGTALTNAVKTRYYGTSMSGLGVSIFFPESGGYWDASTRADYATLKFAQNNLWDEMLTNHFAAPGGGAGSQYADSNNDINSALTVDAAAGQTITGSLSSTADFDDVFAVYLTAGQTLNVAMTGDAGTDFDIYLYSPGTGTVIGNNTYVASATATSYPDTLVYTATEAGYYYVDLYAGSGATWDSGSGNYSAIFSLGSGSPAAVSYSDANNDVSSSVSLPGPWPTVVTGSLSAVPGTTAGSDTDDVFAMHLTQSQTLDVSLTGDSGTDFELWLYPPGTTTVASSSGSLLNTDNTAYPDTIHYVATQSGTFYIDVYAESQTVSPFKNQGSYSMNVNVSGP